MDDETPAVEQSHVWEMTMDLERDTDCLDDDAAERVHKARDAFLEVAGMLTCHVPSDASVENYADHVWMLCKSGMAFRNVIRAEFAKADGHELPPEFQRAEETVH